MDDDNVMGTQGVEGVDTEGMEGMDAEGMEGMDTEGVDPVEGFEAMESTENNTGDLPIHKTLKYEPGVIHSARSNDGDVGGETGTGDTPEDETLHEQEKPLEDRPA